jgi:hypothetical protein
MTTYRRPLLERDAVKPRRFGHRCGAASLREAKRPSNDGNATAPQWIGGAYCRPPWFHNALRPRLILIGEPMPTLRSKLSP